METALSNKLQRAKWNEFLPYFRSIWNQGEHVSMLGPTRSGKTTLALQILDRRRYVAAFATKAKDDTLKPLRKEYEVIEKWPPSSLQKRVLLWPQIRKPEDIRNQRIEFRRALRDIYEAGSWCVFADEVFYLTRYLGLSTDMELLWQQGGSLGISVVGGTQRPAWVPLAMYSEPRHLFLFRATDERNVKRLSEIGGVNAKALKGHVLSLPRHEFVYVDSWNGTMVRSKVEKGG